MGVAIRMAIDLSLDQNNDSLIPELIEIPVYMHKDEKANMVDFLLDEKANMVDLLLV